MTKKIKTLYVVLGLVALLLAVAFGSFFLGRHAQQEGVEVHPVEVGEPSAPQSREVPLYFASAEGLPLTEEKRQIAACQEEIDCIGAVVGELIKGPEGSLSPVLPPSARLLTVSVVEGVATLDFDRVFVAAHPGGSVTELLTIYALADTLAVNFPHIRQVLFRVEGKPIETLKGHVDLRRPIAANFRYTRLNEEVQPLAITPKQESRNE